MDIKTLSTIIGHVSSETTLNIYSHVTDTMRTQAAEKIDREIGGTNASEAQSSSKPQNTETSPVEEKFEPWKPKVRKSGTGCVYQINANLWEGSFYPRMPDGKRKNLMSIQKREKNAKKHSQR